MRRGPRGDAGPAGPPGQVGAEAQEAVSALESEISDLDSPVALEDVETLQGLGGGSLLETTVQQLESDLEQLRSDVDDDEFAYYEGALGTFTSRHAERDRRYTKPMTCAYATGDR